MLKSCKNCRWVGCRNYGWDFNACAKYIPEPELITPKKKKDKKAPK